MLTYTYARCFPLSLHESILTYTLAPSDLSEYLYPHRHCPHVASVGIFTHKPTAFYECCRNLHSRTNAPMLLCRHVHSHAPASLSCGEACVHMHTTTIWPLQTPKVTCALTPRSLPGCGLTGLPTLWSLQEHAPSCQLTSYTLLALGTHETRPFWTLRAHQLPCPLSPLPLQAPPPSSANYSSLLSIHPLLHIH